MNYKSWWTIDNGLFSFRSHSLGAQSNLSGEHVDLPIPLHSSLVLHPSILSWTSKIVLHVPLSLIVGSLQAARVTSKCDKFHRIGLGMRVYGYHNSNQSELDGFLLFLSKAQLRAKLFGLTVRPGKIIAIGIIGLLVFVVLFQTSLIASENFFFWSGQIRDPFLLTCFETPNDTVLFLFL